MDSDKVRLSYALTVSEPGSISISNPKAAKSLKLVATVKQESSPFPDRAVTLLTTYTVLGTGAGDGFSRKLMASPVDVNDRNVQIHMWAFRFRLTYYPLGGVLDLRQREDHELISVPPPGEGSVTVAWSLAPEHLFRYYDATECSLEERLKKFTVGQRFKIGPSGRTNGIWWTWGSLQHELRDKRLSRWSLPSNLPIVREAGDDEGDEIDCRLDDGVDRKNIRTVMGQWAPWHPDTTDEDDNEEPPKVKQMRMDGWVFGEPYSALELTCIQTATFEFVA